MQSILPSSRGLPFSTRFRSLFNELDASAWVSLAVFFLLAALVESAFAVAGEADLEAVGLLVALTDFKTAALALALASCASFLCCHMLTAGGGAALSSLTGGVLSAGLPDSSFFPSFSLLFDFSAGADACDLLSQCESPFVMGGISSSFANVDVEAVPKLGDDAPETAFLVEPVVADLDS